jgi:hypothetical protein
LAVAPATEGITDDHRHSVEQELAEAGETDNVKKERREAPAKKEVTDSGR